MFLLVYLFRTGERPACTPVAACADVNADARVDIADAIYLLRYLFASGPPPGKPSR